MNRTALLALPSLADPPDPTRLETWWPHDLIVVSLAAAWVWAIRSERRWALVTVSLSTASGAVSWWFQLQQGIIEHLGAGAMPGELR